jgi:hypothetical protein
MKTITRRAVNLLLDPIEEHQFLRWAFGLHYLEMDEDIHFLRAWNRRHGVMLKLNEQDPIVEDVEYMIEIWANVGTQNDRTD